MNFDPIMSDPVEIDRQYPPTMMPVTFESSGQLLLGIMLIANGKGPHPTVILLHGFPGNERNFDLAHTLRRAGYNVMVFHYRGTWGSRGSFSFKNVIEDVHVAISFLRKQEICSLYRVDSNRIVLAGHSMGGFATLSNAVNMPEISGFISIAGFNFGLMGKMIRNSNAAMEYMKKMFDESMPPLQGTSTKSLIEEILEYGDALDFLNQSKIIAKRPLLIIGAEYDKVGPIDIHHKPLVESLKKSEPCDLTEVIVKTDHSFSDKRLELARTIISWLDKRFK